MNIADAISQLSDDKGISHDLIRNIVEEFLITAYEHRFHTKENAVVHFNEIDNEPTLFAKKKITELVTDPITEIALEEALQLNEDSEIGDELLIEINPKDFDRQAVQVAKQRAKQCLSDIQKDVLFSEFGDKVGKIVVGYIQRAHEGDIYVSLGNTEGIMPKKYQSPREEYRTGDRIKAIIHEVARGDDGLKVILSRTHNDFVRRIFEIEVPEIQDHIVEIHNIVRDAGHRTKIAVYTSKTDIDPVGACVGIRGARIQSIVKELEGERIDIVNYSTDIKEFIANTLSPARIEHVQILEEKTKTALAVVNNDQLSLAIGKHGMNVRLANKISGWNIDVKTREQVRKMALTSETMKDISQLFDSEDPKRKKEGAEITHVSELPRITPALVLKLQDSRIDNISDLISLSRVERSQLQGLDEKEVALLEDIISENIEVVEDQSSGI